MGSNRLKMNPEKTQVTWLGNKQQLAHLNIAPLHLLDGTIIISTSSVRNLSVTFDNSMTMSEQGNNTVRTCFYQIRQLRSVRRSLSDDATKMLIHAFMSSRLDYCNFLLYGATAQVTRRLQSVLNAAARLVTGLGRFEHITPTLHKQHWLPIRQRIDCKIALLVYTSLHGCSPSYLCDYCIPLSATNPCHEMCSVTRGDLHQPRARTQHFDIHSFRSSASTVWNSLPTDIRDLR